MVRSYPKEINDIKERFFRQAYETLYDNLAELRERERESKGITMNAFNKSINYSGYSAALTTRCEGFKTAILVVEILNNNNM